MSAYADRFTQPQEQLPLAYAVLEPLRDISPSVRDLLCGVIGSDGTEIVKPATIGFFMDGSRLKFVIRPKGLNEQCWGVVLDVRNPFLSIEMALAKNECEWKPNKTADPGSTPY